MEILQFAAAAIVSYLGLPVGFFLASLTKEELPTARKYFPWLASLVFLAAIAIAANFLSLSIAVRVAIYIAALALSVKASSSLLYLALGVAVGLVSKSGDVVLLLSSLVFVFGLLSGSLAFPARMKKGYMVKEMLFLAAGNLSYLAGSILAFALVAAQ